MPVRPRWTSAALPGLALLLCWPALTGGSYFERDVQLVWLTQIEIWRRSILGGAWPTWDPWTGFGQPQLANPSIQALYPATWLNLVLPPAAFYSIYVLAHLTLAGLGARTLAKRLGLDDGAALGAGALYMASGPVLSLVNVWHHLAGAALLPWVMVAALAAIEARSTARALLWSAVPALQIVAGSPDLCLWSWLASLPLVFAGPRPLARLRRLALLGAGAAILGAGQWLATLETAIGSARLELSEAKRTFWSVHPLAVAQLFLPVTNEQLARVASGSPQAFELVSPFLKSLYVGLATLPLVVAGIGVRRRLQACLAAGGLLALLFALGRHAPLYDAATTLLAPLRLLRYPAKAMPLFALAWALLSGLGIGALQRGSRSRTAGVLAILAIAPALLAGETGLVTALATAVVGVVALGGWSRLATLAALVAVAELVFAHRQTNPTMDARLFAAQPALLTALPRGARLHVWDYVMPVPGLTRPWPERVSVLQESPHEYPPGVGSALAMSEYLYPPAAARYGFFGSFDPDLLDLGGRRAYDLNLMARFYWGSPAYARLLAIGSVDRVLALHDEGFEGFERVALAPGLYSQPIRVLRPPLTLPRARVVSGVRIALDEDAYRTLVDPSFDPEREAILPAGSSVPMDPALQGSASVTELRADRVAVTAECDRPALLVLADAWASGWQASVDGRSAPMLRANVLFRAVSLPEGRHEVIFSYRPPLLRAGLALSGVGLGALLALAAAARNGGSQRRGETAAGGVVPSQPA